MSRPQSTTSSILPCTSKADLVVAGRALAVPERTARLLFISHQTHQPYRSGIGISISLEVLGEQIRVDDLSQDEPSTIYAAMPVRRPVDPALVPRPDYYPSYAGLSPEQKWIYLNWLTDVTQPVDVGYAFLYYYGLERHLLLGDSESAFDEILLLQQGQAGNASFQSYSHSALLSSALLRRRPDRLKQLYELHPTERFHNMDLVLAHQLGYDLGPEGLIRVAHSLPGVNKRYMRKNPEEYSRALTDILSRQFGHPFLPLGSAYSISELPREPQILFANISFPAEIRCPALPSFLRHEPFIRDATRILGLAHEETKRALAAARKRSRSRPV